MVLSRTEIRLMTPRTGTESRVSSSTVPPAGVDRWGRFDADEVRRLADGAALVSTVLAQPVTGALEPVAAVSAPLHVDAAQAAGRIEVDPRTLGASFLSLSAHKLGGPQ